jgi:RpiB/LacA/LacB family sugar-phosphate isomerase
LAKTVAIGSDHAGYERKEQIKAHLTQLGIKVEDCGCNSKESVDYPDYAQAVAWNVASKKTDLGILICHTGIGMSISANKVRGIRAALVQDVQAAQKSREHNDANILVLGAGSVDKDQAIRIVDAWNKARFEGGRHSRRVEKIQRLEKDGK